MKGGRLDFYRSKLAEIEKKEGRFVIFTDPVTKKFIQFTSGKKSGFYANVPVKKLTKKEIDKLEKLLGLEMEPLQVDMDVIEKLTEIPGLGWKRAGALAHRLIQRSGGFESIARVSKDDLQKVPGIGEKVSERIVDFLPELEKHISIVRLKAIAEKDYSFSKVCTLKEATDLTKHFFEEVCNLPEDHDISVELYSGEEKCDLCGKILKEPETVLLEISIDEARELGIPEESIQKNIDDEARFAVEESPEFELDELLKYVHERGTIFSTVCANCFEKRRRDSSSLKQNKH